MGSEQSKRAQQRADGRLMDACERGNVEEARAAVRDGANANLNRGTMSPTPLMAAAGRGHKDVCAWTPQPMSRTTVCEIVMCVLFGRVCSWLCVCVCVMVKVCVWVGVCACVCV